MSDPFESTKPAEIARFVGKHFIYTYENGWQYEMYLKNDRTIDYRIHSGMVGGRWVRDQAAHIVRLSDDVIEMDAKKTVCFQNENLDRMREYRDTGLTYPKLVIDEFAPITFLEDCGPDNQDVISRAPGDLPESYTARRN